MNRPPDYQLLLRTAMLDRERALTAWATWRLRTLRTGVLPLDPASLRLLPLVYRNLESFGVRDPLMERLRRSYEDTKARNAHLFDRLGVVLRALSARGIATLVLKGAALATCSYRDLGARPMNDVDVLVPADQARRAFELLPQLGWHHKGASPEIHLPYRHAASFRDSTGLELDLHWHVMSDCGHPDADRAFWEAADDAEIARVPTKVLCAAHQLLHVCAHGVAWRARPSLITWIPDALAVMRSSSAVLDWDRLAADAATWRLGYTLRCAIEHLVDQFGAPAPPSGLARVRTIRTSTLERLEHRTRSRARSDRALGGLPVLWFRFRRLPVAGSPRVRAQAFVDFLRYSWGLQRPGQVFHALLTKALARGVLAPARRHARRLGRRFIRDTGGPQEG